MPRATTPRLGSRAERLYALSDALAAQCSGVWRALVYAICSNGSLVLFASLALRRRATRLAQLVLLGSVLTNLLAVLGCALLAAGLRCRSVALPRRELGMHSTLHLLGAGAVAAMTALVAAGADACTAQAARPRTCGTELAVSRGVALVLLSSYALWLRFAHVTHARLLADDAAGAAAACARAVLAAEPSSPAERSKPSFWANVVLVAVCGALCAGVCAEAIALLHASAALRAGVPRTFMAAVALPLALNAGELAATLPLAARNAFGPAVCVPLTAATQILLCVLPFAVLGAAVRGVPLGLDVRVFEASTLLLGVLASGAALAHGRADWLKGLVLLTMYAVVAAAYWAHS